MSIGLFAQVAQIVMFREMLAICRGTEVFFGVVLAAGLLWTALGSLVAGVLARRGARRWAQAWPARAWAWAVGLFALNGLLLINQIVLARHRSGSWGGAEELTFLEAAATALLATGPVAFACGAEFVLALHAARADDFGKLYQGDAWGAVLGGLAFTFLLVGWLDPVTLGPVLNVALGLAVLAAGGRRGALAGVAVGLLAAAAAWRGGFDEGLHVRRWRALLPDYSLCATRESRYGQLAVVRHPKVAQHTLYLDGVLVQTLAPPSTPPEDDFGLPPLGEPASSDDWDSPPPLDDLGEPTEDELDTAALPARNRALFLAAQHPAPKRVLLVGGALGRLPDELLAMGVEHIDALELDPELFELARAFGEPSIDERVELHFVDGRRFIQQQRGRAEPYDLIVLDLPAPLSGFVNRYFTVEFFREARAILADDGVLITSVMAAANYAGQTVGQLSASVLHTVQEVFPEVLVAPGDRHTFVAGVRPGVVSLDPKVLGRRFDQRGILLPGVEEEGSLEYYTAWFENLVVASQVGRLRADLDSQAAAAPINSDSQPFTYLYALLVWNQITSASTQARDPGIRGGTNALFRAALRLEFVHGLVVPGVVVAGIVVCFAVCGLWRLVRRSAGAVARGTVTYAVLATAFATGLFGMAAEMVLLLGFQSTYGYAYAEVGTIVAAFMVGLAVGARTGVRWERRPGALVALVAVMVAYCLVLPLALLALGMLGAARIGYGGFFVLVFAAGFLDGATFPALVGTLRGLGSQRPGAWVYSADLAGAGLGALATGALLVPTLGTRLALGLVAATLAAALVALGATWHWAAARTVRARSPSAGPTAQ